ncbi:MAG: 23S rRNA (guanosine(2251)-2'-O)-methyltransferase RlmB, partial [Chloroflexota bacterium]
ETVARVSAGAIEYLPVARVGNISQALTDLKDAGCWVVGADMSGDKTCYEQDLRGPVAIVVGGEGKGVSRLVRERCDFLVRLPMRGHVGSLNAAVAGALLIYEVLRQRGAR